MIIKNDIHYSRKKILIYIILAYGFTWILWFPLLLNYPYNRNIFTVPGQFYLASFGPLISAVLTSRICHGKKGVHLWFSRTYSFSFSKKWLVIAVTMPLLYGVIGVVVHRLMLGEWIDFRSFGLTSKLPGFNIWQTALVWISTFGLGEESGWRGFLLPELNKKYSLRISSLMVAAIWIFWHFPAFFFNPTYVQMGAGMIGWAISLTFGSVLLAWISNGSKFSVIPVLIWHGGFDLITASDQAEAAMAMVCSMLVIIHGIYLIRRMARKERINEHVKGCSF
jgi:membrane protease YdiL (CAAX protease family)